MSVKKVDSVPRGTKGVTQVKVKKPIGRMTRYCKQCAMPVKGWADEYCSDWCRRVWHSLRG